MDDADRRRVMLKRRRRRANNRSAVEGRISGRHRAIAGLGSLADVWPREGAR